MCVCVHGMCMEVRGHPTGVRLLGIKPRYWAWDGHMPLLAESSHRPFFQHHDPVYHCVLLAREKRGKATVYNWVVCLTSFSSLLHWSLWESPWNTAPVGRPLEKLTCTLTPMRMLLQPCSRIGPMFVSQAHCFPAMLFCLCMYLGIPLEFCPLANCILFSTTNLKVKRSKFVW